MNQEEIKKRLPHREPMLLLDAVSELTPESSITTGTFINPDWDIFRGHFPAQPVMPGVLLTECMAQAAALLLMETPKNRERLPLLFQIQRMRFIRAVYPSDTLITSAVLISSPGSQLYEFSVSSAVCEKKAASGSITLILK
ncbi:MAG: beta-hydroxyacyl-ACP dehydratase [Lachnospiraceae bacterium]